MAKNKKENKNIILVTVIIATFLVFMLGTAIYTTSKVANCSSGKKLRKVCTLIQPDERKSNHRYS